jgi:hypothetical protein
MFSLRLTATSCSGYLLLMANNLLVSLSTDQLRRIIRLKEQIAALESRLSQVLGAPAPAAPSAKRPGSGKRSAATRARMAAAQKARWAKLKAQPASPSAKMFRRR